MSPGARPMRLLRPTIRDWACWRTRRRREGLRNRRCQARRALEEGRYVRSLVGSNWPGSGLVYAFGAAETLQQIPLRTELDIAVVGCRVHIICDLFEGAQR